MKLKNLSLSLLSVGAMVMSGVVAAEAPTHDAAAVASVWRTDLMGAFTSQTALLKMIPGGQADSIRMSGLHNEQYFDFGLRSDELVSEAKIQLNFTASPSLIPIRSQLNVFLNGQLQKTIPVEESALGKMVRLEVELDPKQVKSHNQIRFQFVGHYQPICESPASDTLWLDVDKSSSLTLTKQKIRLPNDLSKLPAPFVETSTQKASVIPFVFAKSPDSQTKTAAAILSSLFGRVSAWRGADFPVYYNRAPAEGHFVVFVTNKSRPDFLKDLPTVEAPQLMMMDAPHSRYAKMLVVAGRDEQDLVKVAKVLASDEQVLIGERLTIKDYKEPSLREAYEAPNWVNINEPVTLKQLMQYPGQLTSRGYAPAPVHLSARIAPDLFMTGSGSVDMDVKLRYTKPELGDTAQLRVRLNDYLLGAQNLPQAENRETLTFRLLNFYGPLAQSRSESLTLTQDNDLSFEVAYTRTFSEGSAENCKSVVILPQQIEIDPSSTLTFKGLYHYAQLPNLGLFTQSGFPFTKYSDLQETVAVIAKDASAEKLTTLLNAVARMSAATGSSALHLSVIDQLDEAHAKGKDILLVSELPMTLMDFKKADAQDLQNSVIEMLENGRIDDATLMQQRESLYHADGSLGAIVSTQSPYDSQRTVVALMTEGDAGSFLLNEKLKNPATLTSLSGAVAIIQANRDLSFSVGQTYSLGDLPWYHQLWHTVGQYPLILVLCTLVCAILLGAGIFYYMRVWIRRRG